MSTSSKKILVGLSGGVDSAVAAYLLQKQGFQVRAVFMKNFSERVQGVSCPWREDRLSAYRVAAFLNIPIETWNFEKEYREHVLRYMFAEYRTGRTPNPDVMCNRFIKFDAFLRKAQQKGYPLIATGHYARVKRDAAGVAHLLKGKDASKDQSYFLAALSQRQLTRVIFPLGSMKKSAVRARARTIGLPNADRPDSQGICFVGPVSMEAFLKTRIKPKKGDIVDTSGAILGHHQGVYYYTIGQRRGIGIGGGPARYVIAKDIRRNRLIVGRKRELALYSDSLYVSGWHWIAAKYRMPLSCTVKIRYRQNDQRAVVRRTSAKKYRVIFSRPQRAVASGQTLAVYRGEELIASATID